MRLRKKSKEILSERLEGASVEVHSPGHGTSLEGCNGSDDGHPSPDLGPPMRIKPRRARRAMRRAKSSAEDRPRRAFTETDPDPREPPLPRLDFSKARTRARGYSLPETGTAHRAEFEAEDPPIPSEFDSNFSFSSPKGRRGKSADVARGSSEGLKDSPLGIEAPPDCSTTPDDDLKMPEVRFKPQARTSSTRSADRIRRSSRNNSRRRNKGRGRASFNSSSLDSSIESGHLDEDLSFDRSGLFRDSGQSGRSLPSSVTTVERSLTPSTFYTPESSRRSSLNDAPQRSSLERESPARRRNPEPHAVVDESSESNCTLTEPAVIAAGEIANGEELGAVGGEDTQSRRRQLLAMPQYYQPNGSRDDSLLPQSQQSSVVGLDWLFSTDSDSASSGR